VRLVKQCGKCGIVPFNAIIQREGHGGMLGIWLIHNA
jgi:hypothetical protein